MDWCHVAAKCESIVKSSETFVVTVCCSDLMGQLSTESRFAHYWKDWKLKNLVK